MNFVDKIYCINLKRRPDRWEESLKQFERHSLEVQQWFAVDGAQIDEVDLVGLKPGVYGCMWSHCGVIMDAACMNQHAIMIFEDDVELHPGFLPLLKDCIKDLPVDWDVLYLGGSHWEKPVPVTGKIYKVSKTLTTHAYIIRNTMFDRVLKLIKKQEQPIDGIYADLQKEFNCYVTNPPLAWQREDHSDIEGRRMRYDHLKSNEQ